MDEQLLYTSLAPDHQMGLPTQSSPPFGTTRNAILIRGNFLFNRFLLASLWFPFFAYFTPLTGLRLLRRPFQAGDTDTCILLQSGNPSGNAKIPDTLFYYILVVRRVGQKASSNTTTRP